MPWTLSAFADEASPQVDQQIQALKRAGLSLVDLRNVDEHNIVDLPVDQARQVRQKLDDAGISVGMFGSPIGKIDIADDVDVDIKRLEHLGELSGIFGCARVRIFSYYNRKDQVDHEAWKAESLDRLARLTAVAKRCNLVLYHENEAGIFGNQVADVAAIRDQLRAKNPEHFRMIFDFDNFNHTGQDVAAAWKELGDATDAIHLKDSKKQPDGKFQHVPAGTGDTPIRQVLQELKQRNWNGPISLEPHLVHSAAVMATGPSGQANQSLADLGPAECFQLAADHAIDLLKEVDMWEG